MKPIQRILFATLMLCSAAAPAQVEAPEKGEITQLIKDLARLNDMGSACGEHMDYFGKRALAGAVCQEFEQAFHSHWSNRAALLQLINDYRERLELGEYRCERCDVMLERAEELRVFVTYYLDYMDFVKVM